LLHIASVTQPQRRGWRNLSHIALFLQSNTGIGDTGGDYGGYWMRITTEREGREEGLLCCISHAFFQGSRGTVEHFGGAVL
jgi:hypothetical protein